MGRDSKGNTTKRVDPFYVSPEWRKAKAQVLKRDRYICQLCSAKCLGKAKNGISPHVDHITPRRELPRTQWTNPANLRTLCASCHSKVTRYAERDVPTIGADGYAL